MEQKHTHDNDDEPLTFQALGLAAALVVNRIRNAQALRGLSLDQEEDGKENPKPGDKEEAGPEQQREYVETRLREIAAWEAKFMRKRI